VASECWPQHDPPSRSTPANNVVILLQIVMFSVARDRKQLMESGKAAYGAV